jgi:hypothetical protein
LIFAKVAAVTGQGGLDGTRLVFPSRGPDGKPRIARDSRTAI